MRQIKFRQWQANARSFHFWGPEVEGPDGPWFIGPIKGAPSEQFTGLFDKNGREIFEGDILKFDTPLVRLSDGQETEARSVRYYRVGWMLEKACWNKFDGESDLHTGIHGMVGCSRWGEVAGNIHENPELLK